MKFAKMLGLILLAGALVLGFGAFSASAYGQDEDVSVTETVDVGEGGAEEGEGAAAEPQATYRPATIRPTAPTHKPAAAAPTVQSRLKSSQNVVAPMSSIPPQ